MVAAIGEIVKNGIVFDLRNWGKGMRSSPELSHT